MRDFDWNHLRSVLHHDWLQKYITFLHARRDTLDEVSQGKAEWREDIKEQFLEWRGKAGLFKTLIDSCEEALSPRQLLNELPLSSMPQENKEWLGEVIHGLYLERTQIKTAAASLKTLLEAVDAAYENLLGGRCDKGSPVGLFIDKITELSKAISKLPHNIQAV